MTNNRLYNAKVLLRPMFAARPETKAVPLEDVRNSLRGIRNEERTANADGNKAPANRKICRRH